MAVGESAGSVFVTIDGDTSPLLAKYAQAETASRAAGQNVAAGFNAAAAGSDLTSASVDRLIKVIQEESAAASLAAQRNAALAQGIRQVGQAAHGSVTEIQAIGGAIRTGLGEQSIRAVERFLTLIPGLGAALQFAFPVIGAIALASAVDHAVDKVIGLKEAEEQLTKASDAAEESWKRFEQTADRLNVSEIKEKFGNAAGTKAEGTVDQQQLDRDKEALQDAQDRLRILKQSQAESSGAATAAKIAVASDIPYISSIGKDAIKKRLDDVKTLQQEERDLRAAVAEDEYKVGTDQPKTQRSGAQESGSLAAVNAKNAQKEAEDKAEATRSAAEARIKAAHDSRQAEINLIQDTGEREIASAEERKTVAQQTATAQIAYEQSVTKAKIDGINAVAAAESQGKSGPEQEKIATTARGEVGSAQREGLQKQVVAARAADEAENAIGEAHATAERGWADEVARAWEEGIRKRAEATKKLTEEENRAAETAARVAEIQTKGQGDVSILQIQRQKIDLERTYGLQISHSGAEQISQARTLASLDAQERAEKLAIVQAELKEAEAGIAGVRDQQRIASLTAEIGVLKQQNANADAQSTSQIDQQNQKLTQQLSLQQQITNAQNAAQNTLQKNNQNVGSEIGTAIGDLPQSIGNDIGGAISTALLGHHPGKSIGQEMGDALVSSLKSTAAGLLKQLISGGIQFGLGALGFAEGTSSAPGGTALVGERGPEIVNLPRGSQVIPNHAIHKYADGTPGWKSSTHYQSTSFQTGTTNLHFHAHGVNDPDQFTNHVMRKIPEALKRTSPGYSPYSH